jgi:hypothetical protein
MNLEEVAPIIEQIIKDTLTEKRYPFGFANYKGLGNKVSTGTLRSSIQVNVINKPNHSSVLQVLMSDYAQYVQAGRLAGKKGVPIQSLIQWIKARKIKGRNKKGRFISNTSLAFAIQTNIKKYGIRPSNFKDVALDKLFQNQRINELIFEAGFNTLEEGVIEIINKIEGI